MHTGNEKLVFPTSLFKGHILSLIAAQPAGVTGLTEDRADLTLFTDGEERELSGFISQKNSSIAAPACVYRHVVTFIWYTAAMLDALLLQ